MRSCKEKDLTPTRTFLTSIPQDLNLGGASRDIDPVAVMPTFFGVANSNFVPVFSEAALQQPVRRVCRHGGHVRELHFRAVVPYNPGKRLKGVLISTYGLEQPGNPDANWQVDTRLDCRVYYSTKYVASMQSIFCVLD